VRVTDLQPDTLVHVGLASATALTRGSRRLLGGRLDPCGVARVHLWFDAAPERVWPVLVDGSRYGEWVVGVKPVRAVDTGWPRPGASLHYAIGAGPVQVQDRTTVRHSCPEQMLDLDIGGPLGSVRVLIRLQQSGGRTLVTLDEYPDGGLLRLLHTPVGSAAFAARGVLMLHRLRALTRTG
jgi:hypothetical protein